MNVNRKYIKNIKAMIHNCMKDGLNKHIIKPNDLKMIEILVLLFYLDDNKKFLVTDLDS